MDPGIKLFGKNIVLPGDSVECCGAVALQNITSQQEGSLMKPNTTCLENKIVSTLQQRKQNYEEEEIENKDHLAEKQSDTTENLINSKGSPESDGNPKTPSIGEEAATLKPPETENDQTDTNNSQLKTLKKPDTILPCPRCNSMDTKFCYYNNYNINQPRHFCKSCQRYWTAGGTMRNVPVGAGRRKNKNVASHFNHVTISEALEAARIDAPNGIIHHPTFKTNGTILSFNSDPPLGEPMACVLNLEEKKSTRNGFYRLEEGIPVSCKGRENGDNCSSTSFVPTSNSMAEGGRSGIQEPAMPFYPWPYPWNSVVPIPPVCPSGIPVPFFPSPYWNCSVPGGWSIPWVSPSTPILGKRTRDGDLIKPSYFMGKEGVDQKDLERSILVPKTLRIDDPDEAAKSSIWETLGIKNDSISKGGGFFKAFQTKGDEKSHVNTSSPVLQANPAAMSRSLTFQERA